MKYKYGVEYETNGEKPDLPDDVLVQVKLKNDVYDNEWSKELRTVFCSGWSEICTAFRIVDERYKPKEQDMNNDWYEIGDLPPVGEVVVFARKDGFGKGVVTKGWGDGDEVEVISHKIVCGTTLPVCWNPREENSSTVVKDCLRPLRTETDKLVDNAVSVLKIADEAQAMDLSLDNHELVFLAKALINAGYRKIKQQKEKDFSINALRAVGGLDDDEIHPRQYLLDSLRKLHHAGCRFLDKDDD